jgi:isocitrate lyase
MQTFEELVPSAPHGRFAGIDRLYRPDDVLRLRGSLRIQHTLAELGANRLWRAFMVSMAARISSSVSRSQRSRSRSKSAW